MTKIVHLQYSTNSAGRAAIRIQNEFIKANITSEIISLQRDNLGYNGITYLNMRSRIISRIDNKIQSILTRNTIKKFGLFSYPILGTNIANLEAVKEAEVIYIHWVQGGFLNFKSITKIAKLNKPIIIFMHDMWSITGGCHYSFNCEKYKIGCYNCQMFQGQKKNDLAQKGFKKKLNLYSKFDNLYFVTPSQWLYDCAKKSFLTKDKPIFYIPNLLDDTIFKPIDKNTAKYILNIVSDEIVIAFGAMYIDSPYKGWSYLLKALEILKQDGRFQKITVLIFGSKYDKQIADAVPFKTKFLGFLNDSYTMSLVFNAANIFIAPSLAEAFGYVVLESLSCGTPVVGFNVGGIPDMIFHKNNGYLATYKSSEDLARGIKFCIQNNIKGKALPIFNKNAVVQKHIDLIQKITVE